MVALPRTATYEVTVDWGSGTDVSTDPYNDVTADVLGNPGASIQVGRDSIRAFAPPVVPAADVTLNNEQRTYSPGGPIGSFVDRGPDVSIVAGWGEDVPLDDPVVTLDDDTILIGGIWSRPIFTGRVDAPEHTFAFGNKVVRLNCLGELTRLRDAGAITTALYENIRTDEALTVILDAVGWPADQRVIDTGDTTLRYWWLASASAFEAAKQLLRTEGAGAALYEDGEGIIHFEGRNYRQTADRSTTPQYVLWDIATGQAPNINDALTLVNDPNVFLGGGAVGALFYVGDPSYTANPDEVVNQATAKVNARTESASGEVWQLGSVLTLAAGETRDVWVTTNDPFKSAVTPVAGGTDYTVAAGSLASIDLSQVSGTTARLRLVAGGSGATIQGPAGDLTSGIRVQAVAIPVLYQTTVVSTVDTTESQNRYSGGKPKSLDLDLWPELSANDAQDRVNAWVTRYQRPRQQMTVQVMNADGYHMRAMLGIAVSDRVTIVSQQGEISGDFWVETIEHHISTGALHLLTLGCERTFDIDPALFGIARFGFDQFTE